MLEGCVSVSFMRCIEQPNQYSLLIEWESVEAYIAFRDSDFHRNMNVQLAQFWRTGNSANYSVVYDV